MTPGLQIENGTFGPRAIVTAPWSEQVERAVIANRAVELELNHAKGWRGASLEFLERLPFLVGLTVIDLAIDSVEPIHSLHLLKSLELITYCKTPLKFMEFPRLEDCALEWRRGSDSLFKCASIRRLFVNRYDKSETESFGRLTALEELAILGAPISDLKGLRALSKLRSLRVGNCTKLSSLAGIEGLTGLEELEVDTCRHVSSIDELRGLRKLRRLYLNNDGDLRSLNPLEGHTALEVVTFNESTNIRDGDLGPLVSLPNLKRAVFRNRSHYSHTVKDLTDRM